MPAAAAVWLDPVQPEAPLLHRQAALRIQLPLQVGRVPVQVFVGEQKRHQRVHVPCRAVPRLGTNAKPAHGHGAARCTLGWRWRWQRCWRWRWCSVVCVLCVETALDRSVVRFHVRPCHAVVRASRRRCGILRAPFVRVRRGPCSWCTCAVPFLMPTPTPRHATPAGSCHCFLALWRAGVPPVALHGGVQVPSRRAQSGDFPGRLAQVA